MGLPRGHPCSPHNFLLNSSDPKAFVTFQGGRPYLYLAWASFWALYHLAWIIVEIYWAATDDANDALFFIYLTNLGYVILVSFQWLDLVASIYYIIKTRKHGEELYDMPILFKVNWVLYNVSVTSAILIVLLYWILLADSFGPGSINKHLINGIIAVLLVCFTAKPTRIQHVYQPMIFSFLYAIFSVIYYAAGGGNVYSVLDWSNPGTALALTIPLVLVGVPVIHLAVFGMYRARIEIWWKCIVKSDPKDMSPTSGARIGHDPSMGSTVSSGVI